MADGFVHLQGPLDVCIEVGFGLQEVLSREFRIEPSNSSRESSAASASVFFSMIVKVND